MFIKKIFVLSILWLTLASCTLLDTEDAKVNEAYLTGAYDAKLHMLDLSNQELTRIPDFEKYLTGAILDDIWDINFMSNNIENIDSDRLAIFPNLSEVNLSYNKIKEINLNNKFISKIQLHKNELYKADLTWLPNLKEVNLGYNKITTLDNIKLDSKVESIQLQHNELIDLNNISDYKNLNSLKLEFNKLTDDDFDNLDWLYKLKFITIRFNELSKDLEKAFLRFNEENKENKEKEEKEEKELN